MRQPEIPATAKGLCPKCMLKLAWQASSGGEVVRSTRPARARRCRAQHVPFDFVAIFFLFYIESSVCSDAVGWGRFTKQKSVQPDDTLR